MYGFENGPRKRFQYSPKEKKNIAKFAVFVLFMVLVGMAFGWWLMLRLSGV